ncbi:hypothetical protein [Psychroserpens sp.]|uniref:hypothetical protein n=1 Tax=Psychroserpens sp. TaxID=2020870 RepID=UPI00385C7604
MNINQHNLRISLYAIFTFIALVILVDFTVPGRVINDEIITIKKERQDYYNAANNYHYSYKVITSEHEFLVTEDFANLEPVNKNIEYSISLIFKEINWYRLLSSENKSFYSLRIVSGLILPLLAIILIFVAFRYKKEIDILVFIIQVLLIADLIFLII